VVVNYTK
jgi:serine/threonine protein kinase